MNFKNMFTDEEELKVETFKWTKNGVPVAHLNLYIIRMLCIISRSLKHSLLGLNNISVC